MKDFLILIRGGDARMAELSEADRDQHMQQWGAFMTALAETGNLSGGLPLTADARLQSKNGVSDEMVANARGEVIGGYLTLKANDYNHVVELTKNCPVFEHDGNLEIREAMHMEM